jgi:hypothetical protein
MKILFIVDSYPSGPLEIDTLDKAISALGMIDCDVMVVSHLPVHQTIAQKADYFLYDSNNTFLSAQYTPHYWYADPNFTIKIFTPGHTLPICRNMSNGFHLAKSLGYTHFVFMECDVIFNLQDLHKLEIWMQNLKDENKDMLFFKPEGYRYNDSYVYETLLFGGKVDYFLNRFKPPTTEEEWMTSNMGHSLELTFFEKFKDDEHNFIIIDDHSSSIFTLSEVNILRYGLFNCELSYNETDEHLPVLFIINSLIEETFKYVDIYHRDVLIHSTPMGKGHYWFRMFSPDDSEIQVKVYNDEAKLSLFMDKLLICNNDKIKHKSTIKFN